MTKVYAIVDEVTIDGGRRAIDDVLAICQTMDAAEMWLTRFLNMGHDAYIKEYEVIG